jgi:hypothetical protein
MVEPRKDPRTIALHTQWVTEALSSGPAQRLKWSDVDAAFERGVLRSKGRKTIQAAKSIERQDPPTREC